VLKLLGPIRLNTHNYSFIHGLKVLHIFLKLLELEYALIAWNKLTLGHSDKLENIQRKFGNLCYNRFIQPKAFCNRESVLIIYILRRLIPGGRMLTLFFLLTFSQATDCCSIMGTVSLHVPIKYIRDFSSSNVSMSQDIIVQRGVPLLKAAPGDLLTFSINLLSLFKIRSPLFNPIKYENPAMPPTCCLHCHNI
jgi:hypothetical protein